MKACTRAMPSTASTSSSRSIGERPSRSSLLMKVMAGLAFAARHPYALDRLVLLAGAHRPHPLATAQRAVQRGIVRLGVETGQPEQALSLARQLAMTTYRGSEEFSRRFTSAPEFREGRFHFPVEDYLVHQGRRFVERFDVERFLALSESIDLHDVTPERIAAPATLIGFPSDRLVLLSDLCELQRRLHANSRRIWISKAAPADGTRAG